MTKRSLLYLLLFFGCQFFAVHRVLAQTAFPITATLQSIPPHSGNLADWTQPGSNKLAATLLLNDANEISYQARLKVTIEGQGIRLTTRESFIPNPITLSFGSPVQLTGFDMADYFSPENLDFVGISQQAYFDLGGLPDGIYTVCVEVFDLNRFNEEAASREACTVISAVVNDPPVVLSPIGTQTTTVPQFLPIQWQAMHTGAFPVQYDVEIYEWPYSSPLTPNFVILQTQPFFEGSQLVATTLQVGPADPQLELGQRYIVRVRASDLTMVNTFRNDGWSEIQIFEYGQACAYPQGIGVDNITTTSADLSWLAEPGTFNEYVIRYREQLPGANWYEDQVVLTSHV
ncbi:MAG: hypothetical protein AAF544_00855, partial [Bacteroidota bacterium]